MIAALLAAALAGPVPAFGDEQAHAAIWEDLHWNAWLGGNAGVSFFWFAGRDRNKPPTITIRELKCQGRGAGRRCAFKLERTPDPGASEEDRREAALMSCDAPMRFYGDGQEPAWRVPHRWPEDGDAHSLTTMRCRVVKGR